MKNEGTFSISSHVSIIDYSTWIGEVTFCPVWLVVNVLRKTASASVAPSSARLWIIAHFEPDQQIIKFTIF